MVSSRQDIWGCKVIHLFLRPISNIWQDRLRLYNKDNLEIKNSEI